MIRTQISIFDIALRYDVILQLFSLNLMLLKHKCHFYFLPLLSRLLVITYYMHLVVRFLPLVTTMVTKVDHSNDRSNHRSNHRGYYDGYYDRY